MPAFMRPRFWSALRHRLSVAGTFLAYLIATLGLPLPAPAVPKDTSQPFPCQDHPCGCQTAEQCWRRCCCFTPEERWAWARAHQVEPPAYAEKPAEQGWSTVKLRDKDKAKAAPAAKSCCATHQGRSACCQPDSNRPAKQSTPEKNPVRWITGMASWHCQGGPTLWVGVGAVVPVPPPLSWSPDWPLTSRVPLMNAIAWDVPQNPPAPPPRPAVV